MDSHIHLGYLLLNNYGARKVAQAVKGLLGRPEDLSLDAPDPDKEPDTEAQLPQECAVSQRCVCVGGVGGGELLAS